MSSGADAAPPGPERVDRCRVFLPDPCCIVIFGASGDLASRKLFPALFRLFRDRALPERWCIVGTGRTPFTDERFREHVLQAVVTAGLALTGWEDFAPRLSYAPSDDGDPAGYQGLKRHLAERDAASGTGGNLLFHLAVPMFLQERVVRALVASGLAAAGGPGWPRIAVEKPFGSDLASARSLAATLHGGFSEEQVFRIDHYLARETVQNILLFRFANRAFDAAWNREHVERVEVIASETLGMEGRGATYDRTGVVRDMLQNHLMQLLALAAMEPPARLEADEVQAGKCLLFRALRPFPLDDLAGNLVLGQYRGYREEPGVAPDSATPTYARVRLFLDTPRWQGVPFFIASGKRLREKRIEIVLSFKPASLLLPTGVTENDPSRERLILGIHPEEGISLDVLAKRPGHHLCLRSVRMSFDFAQEGKGLLPDPYQKALLDVMCGDHLLFWRQDGVELTWAWFDPILDACTRYVPSPVLHPYEPGSEGPDQVDIAFPRE